MRLLMFAFAQIVQVYDGKDGTAHLLGTFTGTSMQDLSLTSTSNNLWLEFSSDPEGTAAGFRLIYHSKSLFSHPEDHKQCSPFRPVLGAKFKRTLLLTLTYHALLPVCGISEGNHSFTAAFVILYSA